MTDNQPSYFDAPHGTRIAYYSTPGKPLTVVFFGGLMSDMSGAKAVYLEDHCRERGYGYLRFDYGGHGMSSGKFDEGTIGSWNQDALAAVDHLTQGPLLIVGSSMGGWQVLLTALARKDRVKGLIGLASAPDFTEWLLWDKMDEKERKKLKDHGRVSYPSDYGAPYVFTEALIEDGRKRLLLDKPITLDIPVRLIHGMQDKEVPYETSIKITEQLTSNDAELILVKNGVHNLSTMSDLARLTRTVDDLVKGISYDL